MDPGRQLSLQAIQPTGPGFDPGHLPAESQRLLQLAKREVCWGRSCALQQVKLGHRLN